MVTVLTFRSNASSGVGEKVAKIIRRGGVIAMPTESFYALGASALDDAAVRRVCAIKGRPDEKPILVLISDRAQLDTLAAEITPAASLVIEQFWPGPLTIIFPASRLLPDVLTAGTGTVGVRQTAYPALVRLLRQAGPLTGTSANRSGQPPARTAEEVRVRLGSVLDLIVDGGQTPGGLPSTIVDTVGPIRLVREGPISRHQLEAALARSGIGLVSQ